MSTRWALSRRFFKISRADYVAEIERCIAAFEKAFDTAPVVQIKLYRAPEWRPTHWIEGYEHEETAVKILPALKMLTEADWAEARVVETVLTLPDYLENKNGISAVFANIQAKGYFPKQITFYIQGIGADRQCRDVYERSTSGDHGLRVHNTLTHRGIDISFRDHHSQGY